MRIVTVAILAIVMAGCNDPTVTPVKHTNFTPLIMKPVAGAGFLYGEATMEYIVGKNLHSSEHTRLACKPLADADIIAADMGSDFPKDYIAGFYGLSEVRQYCGERNR